jgi:hypothetical protein
LVAVYLSLFPQTASAKIRRLAEPGRALFSYIITFAWQPLRIDLLNLGFDSLLGLDPVQDRADLAQAKAALGGKICLWGGIIGALTLGHGTTEEGARLPAPRWTRWRRGEALSSIQWIRLFRKPRGKTFRR